MNKCYIILPIFLCFLALVKGSQKFYVTPFDLEDCDENIRIFNSEYLPIEKIGPHHVAFNFTHLVLTKMISEPIQIEVVLEKQSSNGKWSFFLKKDFAAICSMIGMKNVPWTVVVDSFPPEKLICPFQPMDIPISFEFDGDISNIFDLSEDHAGVYRVRLIGTGAVGLNPRTPLGCMTAKFTVEGFDE